MNKAIKVYFQYTNVTANSPADYTRVHEQADPATIAAGTSVYTLNIPIVADKQLEDVEIFFVSVALANPPNPQPPCPSNKPSSVHILIDNDDNIVVIDVAPLDTSMSIIDERTILSSVLNNNNTPDDSSDDTFTTVSTSSKVNIRISLLLPPGTTDEDLGQQLKRGQ